MYLREWKREKHLVEKLLQILNLTNQSFLNDFFRFAHQWSGLSFFSWWCFHLQWSNIGTITFWPNFADDFRPPFVLPAKCICFPTYKLSSAATKTLTETRKSNSTLNMYHVYGLYCFFWFVLFYLEFFCCVELCPVLFLTFFFFSPKSAVSLVRKLVISVNFLAFSLKTEDVYFTLFRFSYKMINRVWSGWFNQRTFVVRSNKGNIDFAIISFWPTILEDSKWYAAPEICDAVQCAQQIQRISKSGFNSRSICFWLISSRRFKIKDSGHINPSVLKILLLSLIISGYQAM